MRTHLFWRNFLVILPLALLAIVASLYFFEIPSVGIDDANITFVYSKHLAAGEGLVFNIGGERVEGFSSLSWMLIAAVGYLLSDSPEWLLLAGNAAIVAAALAAACAFLQNYLKLEGAPYAASIVFLLWAFLNPAWVFWNIASLMETGLYSALLLMTVVVLLNSIFDERLTDRQPLLVGLLVSALLITRPDAMAWALALLGAWFVVLRWRSDAPVWKFLLIPVLLAAVTMSALTAFRLGYFGYPLPNTYYAKMSPDRVYNIVQGATYVGGFVVAYPLAGLCVLLSLVAVILNIVPVMQSLFYGGAKLTPQRLALFLVSALILSGVVIAVLMGGDYFGGYRFLQPIWTLLIFVPLFYWQRFGKSFPVAGIVLAVLLFALPMNKTWFNLRDDTQRMHHQWDLAERGRATGHWLEHMFAEAPELPVLGITAAGGIKMGYRGFVFDLLGLNDTEVAHHQGDRKGVAAHASFSKEIFWRRPPGIVEPMLCPPEKRVNRLIDPDNFNHQILKGLPADDDFNERYRFAAIRPATLPGTMWICGYFDRQLLDGLEGSERVSLYLPD